jgi:hypothetical protein
MRANRDLQRLMRERTADNRRQLKFCRCDISAEGDSSRLAGRQCERRWARADRSDRREDVAGFVGGGGEGSAATAKSGSAGCAFGATVGREELVAEWTTAGAVEPAGRRWALSAMRPMVKTAPTTKKYFRISIIPLGQTPAASRFSRAKHS